MEFFYFLLLSAVLIYATCLIKRKLMQKVSTSDNIMTSEMLLAIRKNKSQSFTLIEVTMSLAIIAIGMMGIMALFPIGFQASRNAIGDNYSSEMANNFLHVVAQQCKMYKDNGTTVDGWGEWITDNPNTGSNDPDILPLPTLKPNSGDIENIVKKTVNGAVFGDGVGGYNEDICGIYFDNNAVNGLFYMESKTGDIVDFSGAIALWMEPIQYDTNGDGVISEDIPYSYATKLCIEISWPITAPYNNRETRLYVLEIFNPNRR